MNSFRLSPLFPLIAGAAFAAAPMETIAVELQDATSRILVLAAPQSAVFTEWTRDWCHGGIPVKGPPDKCADGDLSFGGEIYRVKLADVRVIIGQLPPGVTHIGIARHGLKLSRRNRHVWLLVLEPSPPDLSADTGLVYMARDYARTEDSIACLQSPLHESFAVTEVPVSSQAEYETCYTLETILALRKPAP